MAISFLGVMFIAQPPWLVHSINGSGSDDSAVASVGHGAGTVIGIIGAGCAGVAYTLLRAVGKSGEHPLVSVLWLSVMSMPAAAVFLAMLQEPQW